MKSAYRRHSQLLSYRFAARDSSSTVQQSENLMGLRIAIRLEVKSRVRKLNQTLAHGRYFSKIAVRVTHAGAKRKGGHDADLNSARVR